MTTVRMANGGAAIAIFVNLLACGGCGLLGNPLGQVDSISVSVQFYTIPFVCELNEEGEFDESTAVILHNPEANQADIYRRAVLVVVETGPTPPAVSWDRQELGAGRAVKLDCDSFARILTLNPTTTFADQFDEGERVDGFLTLGVQTEATIPRLDAIIQHTSVNDDGEAIITNEPIEPTQVTVTEWPP